MRSQQEVTSMIGELCKSLGHLFPQGSMEAILFGSYARGDADAGSDIDVMILVDAPRRDIAEKNWQIGDIAADFLMGYGVLVSPIVENKAYFKANSDLLPFYRNIVSEGVRIGA